MLTLSSAAEVAGAIDRSRRITLSAYTLHEGEVLEALERAAERHAHVRVTLAALPFGPDASYVSQRNRQAALELRAAGAYVSFDDAVHAKVLDADGAVYVDGQNWNAHDLIFRASDRGSSLLTSKRAALNREARFLAKAAPVHDAIVETETFGDRNSVYAALEALAKNGARVRLLVNARTLDGNDREHIVLAQLQSDGVDVRVCNASEKLALAGSRAWIGSANASPDFGGGDLNEWSATTANKSIVAAARARVEATWANARPFQPRDALS